MSGYIRSNIKLLPRKQPLKSPSMAITLNVGEALYQPSPKVIAAVQEAAASINRYPDNLALRLRQEIARYVGTVDQSQVIVGNGSDGLIDLILKMVLDEGTEILVPIPSYYVYDFTARVLGGKTVTVPRKADFSLDVPALLAAVSPNTRVVFIANPNNPTGNLSPVTEIEEILDHVDCWVVVDEAYFEFAGETVIDLLPRYSNLLVLRSFSKGFGLAGLRVGYCLGQVETIDLMNSADQIFPVNQLGQVAALAALSDVPFMLTQVKQLRERRDRLAIGLTSLGLKVYPSVANFLLIDWSGSEARDLALVNELEARGILVADYSGRPGLAKCHARITIGDEETISTVLTTLGAIINGQESSRAVTSPLGRS